MTDMTETHTVHSYVASRPRTILATTLEVAQKFRKSAIAYFQRPTPHDPRTKAERARLAESLYEEARRKVDRLMM